MHMVADRQLRYWTNEEEDFSQSHIGCQILYNWELGKAYVHFIEPFYHKVRMYSSPVLSSNGRRTLKLSVHLLNTSSDSECRRGCLFTVKFLSPQCMCWRMSMPTNQPYSDFILRNVILLLRFRFYFSQFSAEAAFGAYVSIPRCIQWTVTLSSWQSWTRSRENTS